MAYVIIAKGRGRTYLVTESLSAVSGLALNIVFYEYAGLDGLGWAYAVWYVLYTIIVGVVYFCSFKDTLHRSTLQVSVYAVAATAVVVAVMHYGLWWVAAAVAAATVLIGILVLRKQLR